LFCFSRAAENDFFCSLAENPNVLSVFENKPRKLHTTRSWDFVGLGDGVPGGSGLWKSARFGEETIIGNLDTGVFIFFSSLLRSNQISHGTIWIQDLIAFSFTKFQMLQDFTLFDLMSTCF
jgi:hypothetical protein